MANKQIYELNNAGNDLDNSALLAMDIPNPDSSAASEIPYVTRKASLNAIESQMLGEDEYTTELETKNQTIFSAINEVLTYAKNIANEYDDTATYAIGDFVTYEGVLYKCTVAIPVAEAWNSSHWDSTLIVDEFGGSGGASVTLGTNPPSDASGSNGDLYVQYDGTSYAAVFAYVKINDSWRKYPYAKVVALTRAQYDLITPDNDTLYIITDEQGSYVKLPIITDAWDSSISYTVGMYCIHNDTLWKCTTANTNQEPVSGSTYWDDTSVADEIGRIDTALSGKQDKSWTSITIPTPTIDPNNPNKRIYTFSDLSATNEYCVQIRISNYGVFDIRITRVGQYFLYADDGFKWSAKVNIFASTNTIEVITNSNSYQPTSYPIVLDSLFTR